MDRSTFPFPLAVNSSHHSSYHRFLLGADPSVIAPFPKPYCVGALAGELPGLARSLSLPSWRKLYHGALPWAGGHGPVHYTLENVAPHRPLPADYRRPERRFGAFDFVQCADASVSAIALVAGDRRVLERFIALSDGFCARVEAGALACNPGPSGTRATGRLLAGQFAEPNDRWLMPFLHVHSRVLNFTSFGEAPRRLSCLDHAGLSRAGGRAKGDWLDRQADMLSELGYRVTHCEGKSPALRVDGVSARLLAAMQAPRIAVLRMLERMLAGDRDPCVERLGVDLPAPVIAAMAEQLESALAGCASSYKPAKIGVPSEGPWRASVREHLWRSCGGELAQLDATAARAHAVPIESAVFASPEQDAAHRHSPGTEALEARHQMPADPELGAEPDRAEALRPAPARIVREFEETLADVRARLAHNGPDDPLVRLRLMLNRIDNLAEGASPGQLDQAALFVGAELVRRHRMPEIAGAYDGPPMRGDRGPLPSLDELFAGALVAESVGGREIGGRSL
jgi:TrwC relaxase